MDEILGYGEDAFTFWALSKHISEILKKLGDQSDTSNCLIFFRPSFGRSGGEGSAQFGEFDSILASSENIYLIESKWDNFSENKNDTIALDTEQILRHKIFSWYFINWCTREYTDWKGFCSDLENDFIHNFPDRKIAPIESLLARNLEFVLKKLYEHCKIFSCYREPKNVLLYFYDRNKSIEMRKVITSGDVNFNVVNIDYSPYIVSNFINLG